MMFETVLFGPSGEAPCGCRLTKMVEKAGYHVLLTCPRHGASNEFTTDDVKRHRKLAKTAKRVLAERLAVRQAVTLQMMDEPDSITHVGGIEEDRQIREAETWHTSMADRLERVLADRPADQWASWPKGVPLPSACPDG